MASDIWEGRLLPPAVPAVMLLARAPDGLRFSAHRVVGLSRRRHETLEAQCEPLSVGEILGPIWQMYGAAIEPL
jgi:hypothetical protein